MHSRRKSLKDGGTAGSATPQLPRAVIEVSVGALTGLKRFVESFTLTWHWSKSQFNSEASPLLLHAWMDLNR